VPFGYVAALQLDPVEKKPSEELRDIARFLVSVSPDIRGT